MPFFAWLGLASFAACGDPRLLLGFEVPEAYREQVEEVALRIFQPPVAAAIDCDAIAFGEIDPDVLRASLVGEISVRSTSDVPLADIHRTAVKLFMVEGVGAEGAGVVVGCAELREIRGDVELTIPAEPRARLSVGERPSLSLAPGAALLAPVELAVRDLLDRPLAGVEARWRIEGAGGSGSSGSAVSGEDGGLFVEPALPSNPGPFVLDVRVRWPESELPPLSGFISPEPDVLELPGAALDYRAGALGPNGEPGIAALARGPDPAALEVMLLFAANDGRFMVTRSAPLPGGPARLGLVRGPGDARDRLVVVSTDRWTEIGADGSLTSRVYEPPPGAAGSDPLGVFGAGPCDARSERQELLVTYAADVTGMFDADAGLVGGFAQGIDVLASGCVTAEDGRDVRALVIDGGAEVGLLVGAAVEEDRFLLREWFAVRIGMSFTPPVGGGPRYLLGTQLSVNEFVVSRLGVDVSAETFELEMKGLDRPPAIPLFNAGGDLDGDGALDVASLFGRVPSAESEPVQYALWSVLGRVHRGRRIEGEMDVGPRGLIDPLMLLFDADGDGRDDVVVAERAASDAAAALSRIYVYPMAEATGQ